MIENKVLRSFVNVVLKIIDLIRDFVAKACVFEEVCPSHYFFVVAVVKMFLLHCAAASLFSLYSKAFSAILFSCQ